VVRRELLNKHVSFLMQAPRVLAPILTPVSVSLGNRTLLTLQSTELSSGVSNAWQYTLRIGTPCHPHLDPCSPPPSSFFSSSYPFPPPSNLPFRQLIKSRPKSAYGIQSTHTRSSSSPPTSDPAPANASTSTLSTPHPSETSTSPKRTPTPKHGSRSPPTPRARLGCALKTIWPRVGPLFVVVVGLWVERDYRC
jgi:hypothetical protein